MSVEDILKMLDEVQPNHGVTAADVRAYLKNPSGRQAVEKNDVRQVANDIVATRGGGGY